MGGACSSASRATTRTRGVSAIAARADAVGVAAAKAADKSAEPVPMPRTKPRAAAFQLASADAQIVGQPPKPSRAATAESTKPKPQTPADIINARGFWGETPAAEAGDAGAGRRHQRPPGARGRRPAADRQRFRRVPGAGLRARGRCAGRPRHCRGGQAPIPRSLRPAPRNADGRQPRSTPSPPRGAGPRLARFQRRRGSPPPRAATSGCAS